MSTRDDSVFYTAQQFEEEEPADAAFFHAELALVSYSFLGLKTCKVSCTCWTVIHDFQYYTCAVHWILLGEV